MPHAILRTKFPAAEASAEVTFFGVMERETVAALQAATRASLQQPNRGADSATLTWQQNPSAQNVS
jgi:hypothetical protein